MDKRSHFWLEGFWPGQLWLTYEVTKDEKIREIADKYVDDFYKRVYENNNIDWHHDTGFLYTPSCVSGYKITGSSAATFESGDEGLILHGTVANPQRMADSATQFGDYYYLESLVRATRDWNPYW